MVPTFPCKPRSPRVAGWRSVCREGERSPRRSQHTGPADRFKDHVNRLLWKLALPSTRFFVVLSTSTFPLASAVLQVLRPVEPTELRRKD